MWGEKKFIIYDKRQTKKHIFFLCGMRRMFGLRKFMFIVKLR